MRIPTLSLAVQLSRHACKVAGAYVINLLLATLASAQSYPDKSIRIVTLGAGGGSDFEARLIAQGIAGPLGQAVIVDNRGSGVIAGEIVAKAPPDGYTVLVAGGAFMIGHLQLMFHSLAASMPHAKAGRLTALAVTSAQPSALAPGLPTVAASGLPGYEVASADGAFVPARTPTAIVQRLNQEIVRLLKTSEAREKFFSTGTEVIGSSPEDLAGWLRIEIARMGKVIKDAGIRVE